MNNLDIIIAIILFLFGFKGLRKGLIIEVVTLLALVAGIYGAMHFSDFTAERLVEFIEVNPKYIDTVAFVLTFILLVIVVNIIGRAISKLVETMNLGFLDRLGGFVFGVATGVLLCSLLVLVLNNFQLNGLVKEDTKKESKLYPYVEQTVPYLYKGFDLVKDVIKDKLPEEETSTEEKNPNPPETEII